MYNLHRVGCMNDKYVTVEIQSLRSITSRRVITKICKLKQTQQAMAINVAFV